MNSYVNLNRINQCIYNINKSNYNITKSNTINSYKINTISSNIKCSQVANRNIQEGISFLQFKEDSLNNIKNLITKLKELSIEYKNETITISHKTEIIKEADVILKEINETYDKAQFNNKSVFNQYDLNIQVGCNSDDIFKINKSNFSFKKIDDKFYSTGIKANNSTKIFEFNSSNFEEFKSKFNIENSDIELLNKNFPDSFEFVMYMKCPIYNNYEDKMHIKFKQDNDFRIEDSGQYSISGRWFINGKIREVSGIASFSKENKIISGSLKLAGENYSFEFENINNISDLEKINEFNLDHSDSKKIVHKISICEFKTVENSNLSSSDLKSLLDLSLKNEEFTIDTKLGKKQFMIENNKIKSIESNNSPNELCAEDFLNDTIKIDTLLLTPANKDLRSIGTFVNELERKYNLQENENILKEDYINKNNILNFKNNIVKRNKDSYLMKINELLFSQNNKLSSDIVNHLINI